MSPTRSCIPRLALALLAACGAPAVDEDAAEWLDEASSEQALGIECRGTDPCSGAGALNSTIYRVGLTSTSRGEFVQTFQATAAGTPLGVVLSLRPIRRFPLSAVTLHVEVHGPVAPGTLPANGSTALLQGDAAITDLVRGEVPVELTGSGALVAGQTYALAVRVDGTLAAGESAMVGLGALSLTTYATGESYFRSNRRASVGASWGTARLRPTGGADVAFAFYGGLGSPCEQASQCRAGLECASGACAENLAPSITGVSPASGTSLGGTVLTITGTNFEPGATVALGSVPLATTSLTATQIVVTVPATTTPGARALTVTNTDLLAATQANAFTYLEAGSLQALAAASCVVLRNNGRPTGQYFIDPNGGVTTDAVRVTCDMDNDGGGWVLLVRLDTNDAARRDYADAIWNMGAEVGSLTGSGDYLSFAYDNLPFTALHLRYTYSGGGEIRSSYTNAANANTFRQNLNIPRSNANAAFAQTFTATLNPAHPATEFFGPNLRFQTVGNDSDYSRLWYNLMGVAACNQGGSIGHIGDYGANNWAWEVARGSNLSPGDCQHNYYRLGLGTNYDRKLWGGTDVAPAAYYASGVMYVYAR